MKNIINFKKGKTATAAVITAMLLVIGAGCSFNPKTNGVSTPEPNVPEATETSETTEVSDTEETTEYGEKYEGGPLYNREVDGPRDFAIFVKDQIGTPYAEGGDFPDKGFDEVGFVQYCYKYHCSICLPDTAEKICSAFDGSYDSVPINAIHVGDVVVYESGNVAIYVGNGEVVYASKAAGCVTTGSLTMENIRAIKQFVDYSNTIVGNG